VYAKGLTTGEISAHFHEVYGASIGKDTISRITDAVIEEVQAWCSQPLQGGRFLPNEANPDAKDLRCPDLRGTRLRTTSSGATSS
jgi:hypothetical protein